MSLPVWTTPACKATERHRLCGQHPPAVRASNHAWSYKCLSIKHLLNQQNKKEVYFYNKFYECLVASQTYGRLLNIPLPSFQSQEWEVPCTQTVESVRTKIAADIKNNMKVTFGSRRVHLKWLVPFNVFADLFQRCQEIKKKRTMFTVANCLEAFLHELFGIACLKKEICTGKEVVQAIFDTSSTTFKYIIKTLELHVTFSFRRYKRDGTVFLLIMQH
ncbi:hypothetical protein GOP47_0012339 [Adiantum capillus-veneris]|uniref:Uncharacterized protein n=1 Tax=Adiantum capillus-veneris TaxID=13818 RepID=A0A9D4ZE79_ADICA|nr:hypothetical protein GOP47_0012339 [Adiantum capillus-veneris]